MKINVFIKNTAVLFATSFILRCAGIIFKIFLADKLGSEGMGLYQLIFSVYVLFSTFASSGISTAVTRLVCENENDLQKAHIIIKKATKLTLIISVIILSLVFFSAEFIATYFIKDIRSTKALKILAFSLPFMGLSSCFRGYFLARRKTVGPSLVQLLEQTVRIVIIFTILSVSAEKGLEFSAAAVLFGDTVAEFVSCTVNFLVYKKDIGKIGAKSTEIGVTQKIVKIALPISGSSYLSSLLHTAENLLIPAKLAIFHKTRERGLELFGAIRGMALPLIFFPSSFLTSFSTMLIPEISSAAAQNNTQKIKATVKKSVGTTLILSIFIGTVFWFQAYGISNLFYADSDVGFTVKILAPIIPLMYLESVSAGILKGLDRQVNMFWYNLCDSLVRITAVIVILPHFGIKGYLGIMIVSNCLTSMLSFNCLIKASNIKVQYFNWIIKPVLFGFFGGILANEVTKLINSAFLKTVTAITIQAIVFFPMIFIFNRKHKSNCHSERSEES